MKREDVKARLGLNLQDTIINISAVLFTCGFLVKSMLWQLILFGSTFVLTVSGLMVYFFRKNPKISEKTAFLNKWGSVLIVIVMWVVMILKLIWTLTQA